MAGTQPISVWIADILRLIKAPQTQNNTNNMAAWWHCESVSSGPYASTSYNNAYNLETTTAAAVGFPGYPNLPGYPVAVFPSYQIGLRANVAEMLANAPQIVAALRRDANRSEFAQAVGSSGWGTSPGCISGSSASAGITGGTGTTAGKGTPGTWAQSLGCVPSLILLPWLLTVRLWTCISTRR